MEKGKVRVGESLGVKETKVGGIEGEKSRGKKRG